MENLINWLKLAHATRCGPITAKRLLEKFQDPCNVMQESASALRTLGLKEETITWLTSPAVSWLERSVEWMQQPHHYIITLQDSAYPARLKELPDSPILLYIKGNIEALSQPQIAIVGSRNPTHTGRELAFDFAYQLSQAGLVVTSGLALGIDGASHRGALAANGLTIAVLGHGLYQLYPKSHLQLADQVVQSGALVSEFALITKAEPNNFPQRNRIISGLSLGTLVVEAAQRSGSLITARFAVEQDREVFAIPSSVRNAKARGCHDLIQQGAKLTQNPQDILIELAFFVQNCANKVEKNDFSPQYDRLRPIEKRILDCIDDTGVLVDQIADRLQISVQEINSVLLNLEFRGFIAQTAHGYLRVQI